MNKNEFDSLPLHTENQEAFQKAYLCIEKICKSLRKLKLDACLHALKLKNSQVDEGVMSIIIEHVNIEAISTTLHESAVYISKLHFFRMSYANKVKASKYLGFFSAIDRTLLSQKLHQLLIPNTIQEIEDKALKLSNFLAGLDTIHKELNYLHQESSILIDQFSETDMQLKIEYDVFSHNVETLEKLGKNLATMNRNAHQLVKDTTNRPIITDDFWGTLKTYLEIRKQMPQSVEKHWAMIECIADESLWSNFTDSFNGKAGDLLTDLKQDRDQLKILLKNVAKKIEGLTSKKNMSPESIQEKGYSLPFDNIIIKLHFSFYYPIALGMAKDILLDTLQTQQAISFKALDPSAQLPFKKDRKNNKLKVRLWLDSVARLGELFDPVIEFFGKKSNHPYLRLFYLWKNVRNYHYHARDWKSSQTHINKISQNSTFQTLVIEFNAIANDIEDFLLNNRKLSDKHGFDCPFGAEFTSNYFTPPEHLIEYFMQIDRCLKGQLMLDDRPKQVIKTEEKLLNLDALISSTPPNPQHSQAHLLLQKDLGQLMRYLPDEDFDKIESSRSTKNLDEGFIDKIEHQVAPTRIADLYPFFMKAKLNRSSLAHGETLAAPTKYALTPQEIEDNLTALKQKI